MTEMDNPETKTGEIGENQTATAELGRFWPWRWFHKKPLQHEIVSRNKLLCRSN
jgi:hypothetical protein